MKPIRFQAANLVYHGPTEDIGDLWVHRVRPGVVEAVYELSDRDREMIAAGGRILIGIHSEPMPPISLQAIPEAMCRPVGEHPFKVIPELDDPERNE
jgi:hypothetical protein